MYKLAECLRYYIHDRLNNDPGWKNVKVILSDANVPGEGEHKIMDFIRRQRASPDHDPNTHHVLCGADADLIMLGLATHEPYFTIIREEFKPDKPRPCEICNQYGHETKDCTGSVREKQGKHDEFANGYVPSETNYVYLRLSVLREYLQRELFIPNLTFKFDIERAIDDWVFMCFFVGNDFLPHLPSLEIREGAIDRLVTLYKQYLPNLDGYLTDNGYVNLPRAKKILAGIGEVEDDIFKKRQIRELEYRRRAKDNKRRNNTRGNNGDNMPNRMPDWMKTGPYAPTPLNSIIKTQEVSIESFLVEETKVVGDSHGEKKAIKRKFESETSEIVSKKLETEEGVVVEEIKTIKKKNDDDEDEDNDPVRLWEDGWRQRYYKVKFDVNENDLEFRYKVAEHYTIGLCWVLRYYYQGVPAWNWYFPYHYAPFASDFTNIDNIDVNFTEETEPFKPFEQLMAVFPAASRKHVPVAFQKLMYDPESEIIDFYPEDFQIDLNGKKQSWQGVALLPFVDEERLKDAIKPYYNRLSDEEAKRNVRGSEYLFVHKSHATYEYLSEKCYSVQDDSLHFSLTPGLNDGMSGEVWFDDNYPVNNPTFIKSPIAYLCPDLQNNKSISVKYKDPQFDRTFVFKSCLLENVKMPELTLKPSDWNNNQQYRSNGGFNRDYGQNRNSTVANRMLQHSLNVNADGSTTEEQSCISSAYGGHNSSYYGSYRTNSYGNNRQQDNNNYQQNRYQQSGNNYRQQDQYNNNNSNYQPRNQQYNNSYRQNNNNNNQYDNSQQQYNNNNNNQRNFQPNNNVSYFLKMKNRI
jgi:5'-3' exoribonuclease 2